MVFLETLRKTISPNEWRHAIKEDYLLASWRYFLASDPYTRWGLLKPRGYAGDATLMDFAYRHEAIFCHIKNAGDMGRAIYEMTFEAQQSNSARKRVQLIQDEINRLSSTHENISIGSFASGHARELEGVISNAANIASFYPIDMDGSSITEIEQSFGRRFNINPVRKNVFRLPRKMVENMALNLSYSLGLFDYLDTRHAKYVLETMWQATSNDGTLIIGNLAEDAANIGYCEAIMDWWMVLRSKEQMQELADYVIGLGEASSCELTKVGCFYYLKVTKAA